MSPKNLFYEFRSYKFFCQTTLLHCRSPYAYKLPNFSICNFLNCRSIIFLRTKLLLFWVMSKQTAMCQGLWQEKCVTSPHIYAILFTILLPMSIKIIPLRRCATWIKRFRQRRGYGIHSPFAFNFVTGVVYETGTYYAYQPLRLRYDQTPCKHGLRWKDAKFLFRLANFQRPPSALLQGFGTDGLVQTLLSAGSCHTHFFNIASKASTHMVVMDCNWTLSQARQHLLSLSPGGMLVVQGVGKGTQQTNWTELICLPQAQITFNLYDWGIIMYRPELQRAHYIINYF